MVAKSSILNSVYLLHQYSSVVLDLQNYLSVSSGAFRCRIEKMRGNGEFDVVFKDVVELVLDYIKGSDCAPCFNKSVNFMQPEELRKVMQLCLPLSGNGLSDVVDTVREYMQYSVNTRHPLYFNQLGMGGTDNVAVLAELVTAAVNAGVYTYEAAPASTLLEETVVDELCRLVGFPNGSGVFTSGGSISSTHALMIARDRLRARGIRELERHTVYTSEEGHYWISKACHICGIPLENCVRVPVNENYQIDIHMLEQFMQSDVRAGKVPALVCATIGTTTFGAFDDIVGCRRICDMFDCWLHLDGAWGGAAIFCKNLRSLFAGMNTADSMCINPHKLLGIPYSCSILLVKDKTHLLHGFKNEPSATYLFHEEEYDAIHDRGRTNIQCSRRADAFKLWLSWRVHGCDGFEARISSLLSNAKYFTELIKTHPRFILLQEPQFLNVCFWFIPKSLEGFDAHSPEFRNRIGDVTAKIKQRMLETGALLDTTSFVTTHEILERMTRCGRS